MAKVKVFLRQHRAATVLMGIVLLLTLIPILDTFLVLGNSWQGFPPTFTDETIYFAHVRAIGEGYLTDGNPYFLEHSSGPPVVIFGGAWLNAIPLLAGLSFNATLMLNFILWSLLFAGVLYWLFREVLVPSWVAVAGTVLLYIQSYAHVWRAVNLQPVYPFYFLFYVAIIRLVREQSRLNIGLLAFATGISFYIFAYWWQTVVVTLGLLFLYSLVRKNGSLMKATLLSSLIGGIIGLPVPLYILWLSRSSPYFWESMSRFGLVNTHLPMAEIVYSGGWIGILLALLVVLFWRVRALRGDKRFISLCIFVGVSGFGLWIMQGSNLITGKLLETGEHVKMLILPWLAFTTIIVGVYLWELRMQLSKWLQTLSFVAVAVCAGASMYFTYVYFAPFFKVESNREFWQTEQTYVKPFEWLEQEEKKPVVVWSNPHDYITPNLPIFTKHFTLFTTYTTWQLVSEDEIRERYLISQYFDNPTITSLKSDMDTYLGRQDAHHRAKSIERGIKICRILFFWDKNKECGTPQTPAELLGDKFFSDLEQKFKNDIKPNIKAYLKKYNVSFILKDKILDLQYHPEALGAVRVYEDDRYEIYHL
ncbi:MAG: hypothetical protein WCS97_01470 [Candidatus Paceibacterota bacterium]|jgi:hypothetical protein